MKTPDQIRLAAVVVVVTAVVYLLADHSDVVLNWILELLDNPNF